MRTMGKKELGLGVLAGAGIFMFYVGVLTLAQGFGHAVEQLLGLWFLIVPLAAGFGVQVFLFSQVRRMARTAGVAASGGLTAGSMAACCAHHLADVVPVLGLAGVAGFFVTFQVPFMVLGVAANAVGIVTMLGMMQKYGKWALRGVDMGQVKGGVVTLAVTGVVVTFFLAALYPAAGAQLGGAEKQGAGGGLAGGTTARMGETIISGGTGPGEVSIELTPQVREGKVEVAVAVNTHSVDLTQFDLKQLATLTAGGRDYKPVEAPVLSGHHTTGKMVFEVGELEQMEIVIRGVPAGERVFRWV